MKKPCLILKNIKDETSANEEGFFHSTRLVAEAFDRVTIDRIQKRNPTLGGDIAWCKSTQPLTNGKTFPVYLEYGDGQIEEQ